VTGRKTTGLDKIIKSPYLIPGTGFFYAKKHMKKIIISGEIGWDVTAKTIREQLQAAGGDDIDVHIATPGGYVSTGLEIYNLFRDYKRDNPGTQMLATLKGIVASMGTYLSVNPVFDLVVAEDNAVFMVHNVWGGTAGDYREMSKYSLILEGLTKIIAQAYSDKTKKSLKNMRSMMDDETWLFGSEIKEAGFVDDIIKTESEPDKVAALAEAKIKFQAMSKRLINENKSDYEQIAASLTDANMAPPPASTAGNNNIMEDANMALKELLLANPAAQNEYNDALKAEKEAGIIEGKKSLQAAIDVAAPFLNSKTYPDPIKNMAVEVIRGTMQAESLRATVAGFDAVMEKQKSDDAKSEQKNDTPAQPDNTAPLPKDGVITDEASYQAELNRSKQLDGMEVK